MRLAMWCGVAVTIAGFVAFFAVPNRNTYVAAPGVMAAWVASGGVHGNGLGSGFTTWFWIIAVGVNFLVYSVVAWICVSVFGLLRRRHESSG